MNVAATKELDKKIQILESENLDLKLRVTSLETTQAQQQSEINLLKSELESIKQLITQ